MGIVVFVVAAGLLGAAASRWGADATPELTDEQVNAWFDDARPVSIGR